MHLYIVLLDRILLVIYVNQNKTSWAANKFKLIPKMKLSLDVEMCVILEKVKISVFFSGHDMSCRYRPMKMEHTYMLSR